MSQKHLRLILLSIDSVVALLNTLQQRLIFEILLWTGERMGAIVQLKVGDVYDKNGKVLIVFKMFD
ncbi:MAG TPA: hypothetical protein V6C71_02555 [Coleofasciculaceae cyanobacterium]